MEWVSHLCRGEEHSAPRSKTSATGRADRRARAEVFVYLSLTGALSTTNPYPSIHVVISETLKERSLKAQSRTWDGTGV